MPNSTVPAAAAGLPTRRLFLASGSAGAVLGAVSAAAPAPAGLAELKGLLEAHRRAEAAYKAAQEGADKAKERFYELAKGVNFKRLSVEGWTFNLKDPAGSRATLVNFLNGDLFCLRWNTRHTGVALLRRLEAIWKEVADEKLALFDELAAEVETRRIQAGVEEAARRSRDALDLAETLLLEICAWRCRSIEELRVKGKYLLQNQEFYVNGTQEEALLRSLAEAPDVEG